VSSHLPTHSSREILIIFGSLTTVDPGNIHDTLDVCLKDKIRISVVALAAEMKICREICDKTGGKQISSIFSAQVMITGKQDNLVLL
jgi:transcription initiation factor TFIIH subunit 2